MKIKKIDPIDLAISIILVMWIGIYFYNSYLDEELHREKVRFEMTHMVPKNNQGIK